MITKKSIQKNKLIVEKLPTNAQKLFQQDLDYTKAKTHDAIWAQYFTEVKPTLKEIENCFNVLKPNKSDQYPLIINDNIMYMFGSKVKTVQPNFFIKNLMQFATKESFWDIGGIEFIKNNLNDVLKGFALLKKSNQNTSKVISMIDKNDSWNNFLNLIDEKSISQEPKIKDIVEKNIYDVIDTERFQFLSIFKLVVAGIDLNDDFLDYIVSDKVSIINNDVKRYIIEAIEDPSNAFVYTLCKSKNQKARLNKFLELIQNHPIYIIIRLN